MALSSTSRPFVPPLQPQGKTPQTVPLCPTVMRTRSAAKAITRWIPLTKKHFTPALPKAELGLPPGHSSGTDLPRNLPPACLQLPQSPVQLSALLFPHTPFGFPQAEIHLLKNNKEALI